MKTLKLKFWIFVILFVSSTSLICAQTFQYVWHIEVGESDNFIGYCLEHQIVGSIDYHVTFHVNPKTGEVEKQHNNILHCDIIDLQTGEKLVVIDSGNDGLNYWGNWYFFNDVTGAGLPITSSWPDNGAAGAMVAGAFKWVGKGGVLASMHWIQQVHMNANGEVIVDNYKVNMDCN
jgi:hypothetical protein